MKCYLFLLPGRGSLTRLSTFIFSQHRMKYLNLLDIFIELKSLNSKYDLYLVYQLLKWVIQLTHKTF